MMWLYAVLINVMRMRSAAALNAARTISTVTGSISQPFDAYSYCLRTAVMRLTAKKTRLLTTTPTSAESICARNGGNEEFQPNGLLQIQVTRNPESMPPMAPGAVAPRQFKPKTTAAKNIDAMNFAASRTMNWTISNL